MSGKAGVAITGVGLVTPLGLTSAENVERSCRGESGIERLRAFDTTGQSCTSGAQVSEFDLQSELKYPKSIKFMVRAVRFAMRAAHEAIVQSGVNLADLNGERVAIYTGSGQTGIEYDEFYRALALAWEKDRDFDYKYLGGMPSRMLDRYMCVRTLSNSGLALLSTEFGILGPSNNFVQTDTSSAMALHSGYWDLMEGRCDVAIAGGYDSLLLEGNFLAYQKAGLLSGSDPGLAYRPFDIQRDGLVLGEGAGFLVLERAEDAVARGARTLGRLRNFAFTMDRDPSVQLPFHPGKAVGEAIAKAGSQESFDFVVAQGRGTILDDSHEAGVLASAITPTTPVTAFKSQTGYLGAATAAVELGLGLLCLQRGYVPPIARLCQPDPALPELDFVRKQPRLLSKPNPAGLFLSASWGGQVSAIVAQAIQN